MCPLEKDLMQCLPRRTMFGHPAELGIRRTDMNPKNSNIRMETKISCHIPSVPRPCRSLLDAHKEMSNECHRDKTAFLFERRSSYRVFCRDPPPSDDCDVLKTATDLFRDDVDEKPFRTRLIVLEGLIRERALLPPNQTQCPIAQTSTLGGLNVGLLPE